MEGSATRDSLGRGRRADLTYHREHAERDAARGATGLLKEPCQIPSKDREGRARRELAPVRVRMEVRRRVPMRAVRQRILEDA